MSKQENKDCREVAYQAGFDEGFEKAFEFFTFANDINFRELWTDYLCKFLYVDLMNSNHEYGLTRAHIANEVKNNFIEFTSLRQLYRYLKDFNIQIRIDFRKSSRLKVNAMKHCLKDIEFEIFPSTITAYFETL